MPVEAPSRNKSSVVRLKSGAILFPILCLAFAFNVSGADWPQFLGPNRNGTTTETNLVPGWPREGPPVVWQRKVGEGFSITGIDLVTKGRVPGADEALFKKVAQDAGEKCIVSRALSVPIKVDATFLGA